MTILKSFFPIENFVLPFFVINVDKSLRKNLSVYQKSTFLVPNLSRVFIFVKRIAIVLSVCSLLYLSVCGLKKIQLTNISRFRALALSEKAYFGLSVSVNFLLNILFFSLINKL